MSVTLTNRLNLATTDTILRELTTMTRDIVSGGDPTLTAFREQAEVLGANPVIVGGVAVIHHGYRRTTEDRDVLLLHREAEALANHLMDAPNWERVEIRQYAFLYHPTGIHVDFLVSGHLMQLGRPYFFPGTHQIDVSGEVAGIPVIGLQDLIWLKLVAGRMQDLADIMELCKRHLPNIDIARILQYLQKEDDDLREKLLDIINRVPIELAGEKRLGQDHPES
ncbi:MAG: nucleotidyl transferase AbiEii/AbiGii toxin family protein [Pirellulales bacterium]|nr:nucleotidyl transferase AbiEii/AbiGii toxin family protein [Pirellulales bacterium]